MIRGNEHHGNVQLLHPSKRWVLRPRNERAFYQNVEVNPKRKVKDFVKMLAVKRSWTSMGWESGELPTNSSGTPVLPGRTGQLCGSTSKMLDPNHTVQRQCYQMLIKCMETFYCYLSNKPLSKKVVSVFIYNDVNWFQLYRGSNDTRLQVWALEAQWYKCLHGRGLPHHSSQCLPLHPGGNACYNLLKVKK